MIIGKKRKKINKNKMNFKKNGKKLRDKSFLIISKKLLAIEIKVKINFKVKNFSLLIDQLLLQLLHIVQINLTLILSLQLVCLQEMT